MAELKEQHTSSMQQSANELDYNTTRTHLKLPEYGLFQKNPPECKSN